MEIKLIGILFSATLAAASLGAVELTGANAEIVVADGAPGSVAFAAREMSEILGKALGCKIAIVAAPTEGKASIVLGSNTWSVAVGIDTTKMDRDEFAITCAGGRVYIAGRDAPGDEKETLSYAAKRERATLFGVYEFLHRYAGVRMYFPGELGTVIPKSKSVSVPDGEVRVKPSYVVRRYGPKDGTVPAAALAASGCADESAFKRLSQLRNRLETARIPCCHGQLYSRFYRRFHETHPEYFVMGRDGKRHPTEAVGRPLYNKEHLCHTSKVWDEIYLDAKAYLTGQPPEVRKIPSASGKGYVSGPGAEGRYYDIMPHDGVGQCYCKDCQARYDHSTAQFATELMWSNTVSVARRLKADGVKGYVTQMAYHPYADVPKIDIPDNVLVMVAQQGPWARTDTGKDPDALVKAWADKTGGKVWLWTYPDKIFERQCPNVPQMSPHAWGNYFKRLDKWIIGGFAESESDRWIYNYLNYYVYSRVCWDTGVDLDAVLDEHYRLMFGPAAAQMKAFFESLESKWVKGVTAKTTLNRTGPMSITPGYYEMWAKIYSPELLAWYAKTLDAAAAAVAPGSLEARRIAMFRSEMLDPLVAEAKDAHDSFNVQRSLAKRSAQATGRVVYEDDGSEDFSKWSTWPSVARRPVRANEKGPVSAFSLMLQSEGGSEILRTWLSVPLKPRTKYRLSYFMRLADVKVSARWGRFSCRLKFEGAPKVGRGAPRFIETTDWIFVEREYETPDDLKPETCNIECQFHDAVGRAYLDGLRLEEL